MVWNLKKKTEVAMKDLPEIEPSQVSDERYSPREQELMAELKRLEQDRYEQPRPVPVRPVQNVVPRQVEQTPEVNKDEIADMIIGHLNRVAQLVEVLRRS